MTAPTWYAEAKKLIGVKEAPGTANNATILQWGKNLGAKILGVAFNADSVPWCGVFVAECIRRRGLKLPSIAIRAMSWATWGRDLKTTTLYQGSIVVFQRPGGGHVGFCSGWTDGFVRVLGGNQSNAVNHTWIARDRLVAQRWPSESVQVPTLALKFANRTGTISTNEA